MLSPQEQIAQRLGLSVDQLKAPNPFSEPVNTQADKYQAVRNSDELRRILALPRRPAPGADSPDAVALAAALTKRLARHENPYPGPLRPLQAVALAEAWQFKGLFGPLRAGFGKSLICYLLPTVTNAKRPLYVAPAALEQDMKREFLKLSQHWRGPHPQHFPFLSYETLSAKNAGSKRDAQGQLLRAELLERLQPDLLVFDEAHKIKNQSAVCTKRVRRYLQAHPTTIVAALSGTMMRRSITDFAHLAKWCLRDHCPVPTTFSDLEAWADALDERDALGPRTDIGALTLLGTSEDLDAIAKARGSWDAVDTIRGVIRGAVRRRMVETPGVVATQDGPLDIPLEIHGTGPLTEDPAINEVFTRVRTLWEMPNGEPIADGLQMARHTKTLGLGFWQSWDPPPPDEWLTARREWAAYCRHVVQYNRSGWDAESQVKDAVRDGLLNDQGLLSRWEGAEKTYDPEANAKTEWVSDETVEYARNWMKENPGIIWVDSIELGLRLERELGVPYYAGYGLDGKGRFILDHKPGTPYVASIAANSVGRNLQKGWSTNLWLCTPEEQALARTHRHGQEAEVVRNWLYIGSREHCAAYWKVTRLARGAEQTQGQAHRLCYATVTVPSLDEVEARSTPRWCK